ncbi:hypothetical protein PIB30_031717 [Stylosanthes scabra]|uniref:Aminotransferase-like plant mobile domain-containing protein n=1 Tax=Stylosanthes scabra TaxID=79078 RepID=A0ABU6TC55_9FABA|nr:hypothetical protein [Stylosanthes scabra]
MFGKPPTPPAAGECTVTFSWLRSTFGLLPDEPTDVMVLMHARAYIWMLLSTCLFGDKTGVRAHVRWLPFLLRIDDLGGYSWGPQCWPDCTGTCVEQPTGMSSRWLGRWFCCRAGFSGAFLSFALPVSTTLSGPSARLVEAVLDGCILQEEHRALWCSIIPLIYFGTIEWHQVDRVIPQFGEV